MATDDTPTARPGLSFGSVAEAYDRGRPGYPRAAAVWLTGDRPLSVLELGAGTGKLTEQLVALGHDVHATDPDPAMLDHLARTVHVGRISQTSAEEIPAADASYDVVVVGQAYHWFDQEKALPEIARVLKRGGSLSLVWNVRDERVPWVRRLGAIIGRQDVLAAGPDEALESSPYFGPLEEATFKQWQVVDRQSIRDLVLSRSNVAVLGPEERERVLREVLAFYDDFGRGMDGMQLPYLTRCWRAVVGIKPQSTRPPAGTTSAADSGAGSGGGSGGDADSVGNCEGDAGAGPVEGVAAAVDLPPAAEPPADPADDDSGVLLIDFR